MNKKIKIYSKSEIIKIRNACYASAFVRENLKKSILPGMNTKLIDDIAYNLIKSTGGKSAFLNYNGFPSNICISINDEVVHGVAKKDKIVKDGDIVSIDVGVCLDNYFGDNAETFIIGNKSDDYKDAEFLIHKTEESLLCGIEMAIEGNYVVDISRAIQNIADDANLSIVRDYVGHGCGENLHEFPEIPNYVTNNSDIILKSGMILSIEPMLNLGSHRVTLCDDEWTVRTEDGSLSSHFEHTILVNGDTPEILTCLIKK